MRQNSDMFAFEVRRLLPGLASDACGGNGPTSVHSDPDVPKAKPRKESSLSAGYRGGDMGLRGVEPLTSRLSGVRSNQLSYRPHSGRAQQFTLPAIVGQSQRWPRDANPPAASYPDFVQIMMSPQYVSVPTPLYSGGMLAGPL